MKQKNYELGKLGENLAKKYLRENNYKIVAKNWKTKFGEVDIIASKNNLLVFVEVKLKIGEDFGTPEEMISSFKINQVQNTAIAFLQQNPLIEKKHNGYQIDAICIVLDKNQETKRVSHYQNLTF